MKRPPFVALGSSATVSAVYGLVAPVSGQAWPVRAWRPSVGGIAALPPTSSIKDPIPRRFSTFTCPTSQPLLAPLVGPRTYDSTAAWLRPPPLAQRHRPSRPAFTRHPFLPTIPYSTPLRRLTAPVPSSVLSSLVPLYAPCRKSFAAKSPCRGSRTISSPIRQCSLRLNDNLLLGPL